MSQMAPGLWVWRFVSEAHPRMVHLAGEVQTGRSGQTARTFCDQILNGRTVTGYETMNGDPADNRRTNCQSCLNSIAAAINRMRWVVDGEEQDEEPRMWRSGKKVNRE